MNTDQGNSTTRSTRIVTVTPNPSLDRTIELAGELQRGAVQRATRSTAEPGGKGVNVSRVVVASGGDTVAVLPGDELDPVLLGLATRGIPTAAMPIGCRSARTSRSPNRPAPPRSSTNPGRPSPDASTSSALVADAAGPTPTGPGARWVVLAGSLPPGLPDDALAELVRAVRARHGEDVRIAVDSSGVPFTALLQSGERIDLVKPNAEELAEVVGGDPDEYERDLDAAAAAAERLRSRGVDTVLLTLGSAGAVLVGPTAHTPPPHRGSSPARPSARETPPSPVTCSPRSRERGRRSASPRPSRPERQQPRSPAATSPHSTTPTPRPSRSADCGPRHRGPRHTGAIGDRGGDTRRGVRTGLTRTTRAPPPHRSTKHGPRPRRHCKGATHVRRHDAAPHQR